MCKIGMPNRNPGTYLLREPPYFCTVNPPTGGRNEPDKNRNDMYLEKIDSPADVKRLSVGELTLLSGEIREALLHKVSAHGGHFGPNLGMVEAAVALHYVFDSPKDKLVFDVSHQSYVH